MQSIQIGEVDTTEDVELFINQIEYNRPNLDAKIQHINVSLKDINLQTAISMYLKRVGQTVKLLRCMQ